MNLFDDPGKLQENNPDTKMGSVNLSPVEFLNVHESSFVALPKDGLFKLSDCVIAQNVDSDVIALLTRIKHHDRTAFREFYDLYAERIGSFLMKQLRNPDLVGEAVNDVMLAIWQHAGDFDPAKGKFTTWLFGIANNKGLKIRERSRRFIAEQPFEHSITDADAALDNGWEQLDPSQTPEQTILGWEVLDMLKSALELLSSDHREILELSYGGEHSYQEIADLLGCPANTVKTRVFHARKKLFMHLQRKGYAPATLQQES